MQQALNQVKNVLQYAGNQKQAERPCG